MLEVMSFVLSSSFLGSSLYTSCVCFGTFVLWVLLFVVFFLCFIIFLFFIDKKKKGIQDFSIRWLMPIGGKNPL